MTFCNQLKVGLTGSEEQFNQPLFSVDSNEFFFRKTRIYADEGDSVVFVVNTGILL